MEKDLPLRLWCSDGTFNMSTNRIIHGNALCALSVIQDNSVHCCVTSPPYWGLRSNRTEHQQWPNGWVGELGMEPNPKMYIDHLVLIFREVRRVLHPSGTCFVNIGDSYANNKVFSSLKKGLKCPSGIKTPDGLKRKDCIGIPWMLAFSMRYDGWCWRGTNIWHKPNQMPASYTDRCVTDYEPIHHFTKSENYFFDHVAIQEKSSDNPDTVERRHRTDNGSIGTAGLRDSRIGQSGRGLNTNNKGETRKKRSVWSINTKQTDAPHFSSFPEEIPEICIKAGTSEAGCCPRCLAPVERLRSNKWARTCECDESDSVQCTVLDPFMGSGTTAVAAMKLERKWIGCELNKDYIDLANSRIFGSIKKGES